MSDDLTEQTDDVTAPPTIPHRRWRGVVRWLLAATMIAIGFVHLFAGRREFRAQVPEWATRVLDEDAIVVASGVVEIMLGGALVALPRSRSRIGSFLALFFIAVFPGNVEQYTKRRDGFGLDTDRKRLARVFFQPVLVVVAWWCTRTPRTR